MTDRKYLKTMVELGEELDRIASAVPYDSEAHKKVIDSINRTNRIWYNSRRRYCWISDALIVLLFCLLAWIVWSILY